MRAAFEGIHGYQIPVCRKKNSTFNTVEQRGIVSK